jgi:hypothetical protein
LLRQRGSWFDKLTTNGGFVLGQIPVGFEWAPAGAWFKMTDRFPLMQQCLISLE